jgi:hypothetical protein
MKVFAAGILPHFEHDRKQSVAHPSNGPELFWGIGSLV